MFNQKISEQKLQEAIKLARLSPDFSPAYGEQVKFDAVKKWRENTTPEMPGCKPPKELVAKNTFTRDGFTVRRKQFPEPSSRGWWTIRTVAIVEGYGFWVQWDSYSGVEFIGEPGNDEGISWSDWQEYWAEDCLMPKALER